MNSVRRRRLQTDYERLKKVVSSHSSSMGIESAVGDPPESYVLIFRGRSVSEVRGKVPVFCERQRLKIEMPADYPAVPPLVTVFGAIFHPHIWPGNNVVCLGSWNITEPLDNLVLRLRSMLHYHPDQLLNWKSVANQDAAEWARRNQHLFSLGADESQSASARRMSRRYETA